jgi:hypothetical protein
MKIGKSIRKEHNTVVRYGVHKVLTDIITRDVWNDVNHGIYYRIMNGLSWT